MRTYVSKEKYEAFRNWLINVVGVELEPMLGEYEVMRWKHHRPGKPKPICFRREGTEVITLNTEAAKYYGEYERREKHARNVHGPKPT